MSPPSGGPEPASAGPSGPTTPVPGPAFDGGPSLGGPAFPSSSQSDDSISSLDRESIGMVPHASAARAGSAPVEPTKPAGTPLRTVRGIETPAPQSRAPTPAPPAVVDIDDDGWRAADAPPTVAPEPRLFPIGDVRVRPIR